MKLTLSALLDRLGSHSKAELQTLAERRGLPTKGSKDELIARLVEVKQPQRDSLAYEPAPQ